MEKPSFPCIQCKKNYKTQDCTVCTKESDYYNDKILIDQTDLIPCCDWDKINLLTVQAKTKKGFEYLKYVLTSKKELCLQPKH
jgi:hypothetical protein